LVVETDNLLRDLLQLSLTRAGYEVRTAPDPAAALALVDGGAAPDAAVIDLFQPGMSGLKLMQALRARPGLATLPLIVISALGFGEVVEQAVAAGANDFILKPFDPAVLAQKVGRLLA
jgi:CheY-like chemotaxis protein